VKSQALLFIVAGLIFPAVLAWGQDGTGSDTLANLPRISRVTLEPQGQAAEFVQEGGALRLQLDGFTCHQMISLQES